MKLKKLFDDWAGEAHKKYDQQQWLLSKWEIYEGIEWPEEKTKVLLKTLTAGLKLEKQHSLIELGCGGGWILKELSAFVNDVYALDFSQDMLRVAAKTLQSDSLVCGEIGRLPLHDQSFDRILSYYVFMNFADDDYVKQAIGEIYRILKPGGQALIGQLPLAGGSANYEQAKEEYFQYCQKTYDVGKSIREDSKPPLRLFNKDELSAFLKERNISFSFADSFNPFYRKDQPEVVDWRFDLIIEKS